MKQIIIATTITIAFIVTTQAQAEIIPLNKDYFNIEYNTDYKGASKVSYTLIRENIKVGIKKRPKFYTEPALDKQVQTHKTDYTNTGYDRGHLANDASFDWSKPSQLATYSMANIIPQLPNVNRKAWLSVEEMERYTAKQFDTLHVTNIVDYRNAKILKKLPVEEAIKKNKIKFKDEKHRFNYIKKYKRAEKALANKKIYIPNGTWKVLENKVHNFKECYFVPNNESINIKDAQKYQVDCATVIEKPAPLDTTNITIDKPTHNPPSSTEPNPPSSTKPNSDDSSDKDTVSEIEELSLAIKNLNKQYQSLEKQYKKLQSLQEASTTGEVNASENKGVSGGTVYTHLQKNYDNKLAIAEKLSGKLDKNAVKSITSTTLDISDNNNVAHGEVSINIRQQSIDEQKLTETLQNKINQKIDRTEIGQFIDRKIGDYPQNNLVGDKNINVVNNDSAINIKLADQVSVKSIITDSIMTGSINISKTGIDSGNTKITNVADGTLSTTSKEVVTGSQLYETNKNVEELTNNHQQLQTVVEKGFDIIVDNGDISNIKLGDSVIISGDDENIATTLDNNEVILSLKKNITVDNLKSGDIIVAKDGINAGNKKITNVADGKISLNSRDAVNGAQLYRVLNDNQTTQLAPKTLNQITQNTKDIANIEKSIKAITRQQYASTASSLAASGLLQTSTVGKSGISASVGQYQSQVALAIGYSQMFNNNIGIKASLTTNTAEEFGSNIGIGYFW